MAQLQQSDPGGCGLAPPTPGENRPPVEHVVTSLGTSRESNAKLVAETS